MLFRTHVVFSLAVWFVLSYYIAMPLYVLGFVLLATVFVDIDIKNSKGGNRWYLRPVQWLTRHRGVFHSLFAGVLFLETMKITAINTQVKTARSFLKYGTSTRPWMSISMRPAEAARTSRLFLFF